LTRLIGLDKTDSIKVWQDGRNTEHLLAGQEQMMECLEAKIEASQERMEAK
jgi:hypothetical protein